jgi:hypothetical protein
LKAICGTANVAFVSATSVNQCAPIYVLTMISPSKTFHRTVVVNMKAKYTLTLKCGRLAFVKCVTAMKEPPFVPESAIPDNVSATLLPLPTAQQARFPVD